MDKYDQTTEQIRVIFNGFCSPDKEGLNKGQLLQLCNRLELDDLFIERIADSAFPQVDDSLESDVIDFETFCNCFAKILQLQQQDEESDVECKIAVTEDQGFNEKQEQDDHLVTEIQPRYVKDGKSYGRKSVPIISTLNEEHFDDNSNDKNTVIRWSENSDNKDEEVFHIDGSGDASNIKIKYDKFSENSETHDEDQVDEVLVDEFIPVDKDQVNIFAEFDDLGDGSVDINKIFQLWKLSGITEPSSVLNILGIKPNWEDRIDGLKLSDSLERFVLVPQDPPSTPAQMHTMMCAFVTSARHQLLHFNSLAESFKQHNDEIKETLNRSQLRTSMLVEEADHRYLTIDQQNEMEMSNLDKEWQQRLDTTLAQFNRERNSLISQAEKERSSLHQQIDQLQQEVASNQHEIQMLKSDNASLNQESHQIYDKLNESQKEAQLLRNDLECLLSTQINDDGDPINTSQEEKFAKIIKEYEAQCRSLGDRNDELATEVYSLRSLVKQKRNNMERTSSSIEHNKSNNIGEERGSDFLLSEESSASGRTRAKLSELQSAVDLLKKEKKEEKTAFEEEKDNLIRNYEEQIKSIRSEVVEKDDKYSELLSSTTKERDKLTSLVEQLTQDVNSSSEDKQDAMTKLCREFANEKSELVKKFQTEMEERDKQIEQLTTSLREQSSRTEKLEERLEEEKLARFADEEKLQETIEELEKSFATERHDISQHLEKEMDQKLQDEIMKIRQDAEQEIEMLQISLDEKTKALEDEKIRKIEAAELKEIDAERMSERENELLNELDNLRREMDKDKSQLKTLLNKEMEDRTSRMQREFDEKIEQMTSELKKEHQRDIAQLQAENDDLTDQILLVKAENSDLESKAGIIDDQVLQLDSLNDKIKKQTSQNDQLQLKLANCEKLVEEKSSLYSNACEDLNQSKTANLKLEKVNEEILQKLRAYENKPTIEEKYQACKDELKSMKKSARSKDKLIKEYKEEISNLRNQDDSEHVKARVNMYKTRYFKNVEILNEQMEKNKLLYAKLAKTEVLAKDLYCENANMMKALQLTELRQKQAEQKCKDERDKTEIFANVLKNVATQIADKTTVST